MNNLLRTVVSFSLPFLFLAIGAACLWVVLALIKSALKRSTGRSPLTREMLRPPGSSLRARIAKLDQEAVASVIVIALTPMFVFMAFQHQAARGGMGSVLIQTVVAIVVSIGLIAAYSRVLWHAVIERRKSVLGLEGELATAEELNRLMLKGCHVYHDIPFEYGNIDHVVVSSSGVYAVDTKMHSRNGDANEAVVDRDTIHFPDRDFAIPIKQLETASNWLSKYLTSATRIPVNAEPMVALPGWFVKRKERGKVYVINPTNPHRFFIHDKRQRFSTSEMEQIAHQLDRLCRDVQPSFQDREPFIPE